MTHATDDTRARDVQRMFARIAFRYDAMNRLMTAGQDVRWRREVIRRAGLQAGDRLLDLGAGTGDLAREAMRQRPACFVVAADFTIEMMQAGKRPSTAARDPSAPLRFAQGTPLLWCAADALHLPFADAAFDAIVSGFLLRNVVDIRSALREQYRVLRPGGRWVSLDTTPPRRSLLHPLIQFHLHRVIPTLGRLLTGHRDAYTYLPDSTEKFLTAEQLAEWLSEAGFQAIGFTRRMFGAIAIHWAKKTAVESASA